jgi:hypothetical protein
MGDGAIGNMGRFPSADEEMGGGLGELARDQTVITYNEVEDATAELKTEF